MDFQHVQPARSCHRMTDAFHAVKGRTNPVETETGCTRFCPYMWTTPGTGSTTIDNCTEIWCPPGKFVRPEYEDYFGE